MQLLIDARALLKGYFHMEGPERFDPHAQEMRVESVLPNGVPVRGFIDRVDIADSGEVRVVAIRPAKCRRHGSQTARCFRCDSMRWCTGVSLTSSQRS